eukprot:TRINITY_DN55647_c0_g1_i1.p1 TRINITY_DN55647_c0_g1~~TRINITY_DN55647_c0_g1_i1.p1  ORF type:complete len:151 (-),score=45.54 TRINITY_DN55647_c0_g1_i1:115-567(-)
MLGFILFPITFVLVTMYAPLMSIRALKTGKNTGDDTQWLAFWVTWTFITSIDSLTFNLPWLIPFFGEMRFALLIYMLFFEGSKKIFDVAIDPLYKKAVERIPEELLKQVETDPVGFAKDMFEKAKVFAKEKHAQMTAEKPHPTGKTSKKK